MMAGCFSVPTTWEDSELARVWSSRCACVVELTGWCLYVNDGFVGGHFKIACDRRESNPDRLLGRQP